jgi:putative phosphoesterase
MHRIGLISDTHGLLRPEAAALLTGCTAIVHAGDIGKAPVLAALSNIAPVTAVRGNNDCGARADTLPTVATLRLHGIVIHVRHELSGLALDRPETGFDVVV